LDGRSQRAPIDSAPRRRARAARARKSAGRLVVRCRDERGIALLVALMSMTLLMTLGGGLIVLTITETRIAATYRDGIEAFYAADAAIERVIPDLQAASDWDALFAGRVRSSFVDGPAEGLRALDDGTHVNLAEITNMARCGKSTACSASDMDAYTEERPWGHNNPRWALYAYGRLRTVLPAGRFDSPAYVVVLIADDALENDGDPYTDGASTANPGRGALALRAHAYGPLGVRRVIEVIVCRSQHGMRVVSWQELR
jgi:hypothetical protein